MHNPLTDCYGQGARHTAVRGGKRTMHIYTTLTTLLAVLLQYCSYPWATAILWLATS